MNFCKKRIYFILFVNLCSPLFSQQQSNYKTSQSQQEENVTTEINQVTTEDQPEKITGEKNLVELRARPQPIHRTHKKWTMMVYIAADNDLRGFAARNIKQMAAIGSNEYINILVHLDIKITGNKKITRRYYIENGKINHMNGNDPATARMDSGSPETLISFADWAITHYPAEKYCLILWNHGTGPIDPGKGKIINPSRLFALNPTTHKWELDRSMGFLDYVCNFNNKSRGIAWDDTTGNYLTNQTLEYALGVIKENILGEKLSIIGFDACLMSTLEIANIVKQYAHYCVASEEVEMGTGWKYNDIFAPFLSQDMDEETFASHIVRVYEKTYEKINDDFTLSALALKIIDYLETAVDDLAHSLVQALGSQKHTSVMRWIKNSKNTATRFDEPSYIDLHHFLRNLSTHINAIEFLPGQDKHTFIREINRHISTCINLLEEAVVENTAGPNVSQARGISIYFPEKKIHPSYKNCNFARQNNWYKLISMLTTA